MSHFYSTIQGHKGEATRTGSKNSGITANAFGWDIGGRTVVKFDPRLNTDVVHLYTTRGNNLTSHLVASFAVINGTLTPLQPNYPELFL